MSQVKGRVGIRYFSYRAAHLAFNWEAEKQRNDSCQERAPISHTLSVVKFLLLYTLPTLSRVVVLTLTL